MIRDIKKRHEGGPGAPGSANAKPKTASAEARDSAEACPAKRPNKRHQKRHEKGHKGGPGISERGPEPETSQRQGMRLRVGVRGQAA